MENMTKFRGFSVGKDEGCFSRESPAYFAVEQDQPGLRLSSCTASSFRPSGQSIVHSSHSIPFFSNRSPRRPILRPRKPQLDFPPFNILSKSLNTNKTSTIDILPAPSKPPQLSIMILYAIHAVSGGIASVESSVFLCMFCAFQCNIRCLRRRLVNLLFRSDTAPSGKQQAVTRLLSPKYKLLFVLNYSILNGKISYAIRGIEACATSTTSRGTVRWVRLPHFGLSAVRVN